MHNLPSSEFSMPAGGAASVRKLTLPSRDQVTEIPPDFPVKAHGVYGFDSLDPRSRHFNLIRARLLEAHHARGWRMMGIVSATPQVGKSFISANVAAALSRNPHHQTYLLDLDLRRASLTDLFAINSHFSIREYLEADAGAVMPEAYALHGEELIILPTNHGAVHSAELLSSERAQDMLGVMRSSESRNLFLADLPPVFANDDASIVMRMLDGYILVAEEGRTTQREVEDVISLLGSEKLVGVILNKYRGGLLSEGYGVDAYYGSGYGDSAG